MAKPIKFRSKKEFKIVSRCIICGKIIPIGDVICSSCDNTRLRILRKLRK